MKINNIFEQAFTQCVDINNIRDKVSENIFEDDIIKKYVNGINKFLQLYPIAGDESDFFKSLTYNFWNILYLYIHQKTLDNCRGKRALGEFINVGLRVVELSIFLKYNNLSFLIKKLFSTPIFNTCFYMHFKKIKKDVSNKDIKVDFISENKTNLRVLVADLNYHSSSMPQNQETDDKSEVWWFERIFKLENKDIFAIFNAEGSKNENKSGGSGSKRGKRVGFGNTCLISQSFSNKKPGDKISHEGKNEFLAKENQLQSVIYLPKLGLTKKNIQKYNTNSKYKQSLINKAISTALTKKSMYLESAYKYPDINLLSQFVSILFENKDNLYIQLILISTFSGIPIKRLMYSFLYRELDLKYIATYGIFKDKILDEIYANSTKVNEVTKKVNNKVAQLYLPEFLQRLCKVAQLHLQDKIKELEKTKDIDEDSIEDFIEGEVKSTDKVLKKYQKLFDKEISFSLNNIPIFLRHYFKQFNKFSDVGILFTVEASKSDNAKMCYVVQPSRLIIRENWIKDFYNILTSDSTMVKPVNTIETEYIGSPKFVEDNVFRSFIDDIDSLSLSNDDEIIRINLQMILIRYILSLLLVSRDYKQSCNLYNYSKRLQIITIQEKAKNLRTAKRVIPLTKTATLYIDLFYKIKEQYNIDGFVPVLLSETSSGIKQSELNDENILNFIRSISDEYTYIKIEKFINGTTTNVGRHIFSTIARKTDLLDEYENAFLNHFHIGKVDQGVYSNFDNQKYFKEIRMFIELELERNYLPSKIYLLENKENGN